jgi:hypothetical protein
MQIIRITWRPSATGSGSIIIFVLELANPLWSFHFTTLRLTNRDESGAAAQQIAGLRAERRGVGQL